MLSLKHLSVEFQQFDSHVQEVQAEHTHVTGNDSEAEVRPRLDVFEVTLAVYLDHHCKGTRDKEEALI